MQFLSTRCRFTQIGAQIVSLKNKQAISTRFICTQMYRGSQKKRISRVTDYMSREKQLFSITFKRLNYKCSCSFKLA